MLNRLTNFNNQLILIAKMSFKHKSKQVHNFNNELSPKDLNLEIFILKFFKSEKVLSKSGLEVKGEIEID